LNQLAWLLSTCADVRLRDGTRAVRLAEKAVELSPKTGAYWNTLGAAHYRAGDWAACLQAMDQSMEHRSGGDSFDWLFLAMAHWQLGNHDEAQRWYTQAAAWMQEHSTQDQALFRIRAEAEELLSRGQRHD
jgi:Flp pilus assembly protein TadD